MGGHTLKQMPFSMINAIMRFSTGRTRTLGKALTGLLGGRWVREGGTEEITLELKAEQEFVQQTIEGTAWRRIAKHRGMRSRRLGKLLVLHMIRTA